VTSPQVLICLLLAGVLGLFASGRWRYDVVAFLALMVAVLLRLVPFEQAFAGFGHPATVTVAMVLILSRVLSATGATDVLIRYVMAATTTTPRHIAALAGIGALMSAVMNNVGALALLMPIAMASAARAERSPSLLLMPLSFASILGGLITLIGTPPNIIVATYRTEIAGAPFGMFDFTPVGGVCALAGVAFIALIGWRLIPGPRRAQGGVETFFAIDDYVAEAGVVEGARAVGKSLAEIDEMTSDIDALVVALIRGQRRLLPASSRFERLQADDILLIEAGPEELDRFVAELGLKFAGGEARPIEALRGEEVEIVEAVVPAGTSVEGRTIGSLRLRRRFGVNLLATSRQGKPYRGRLRNFRIRAGDVLLLQGETDRLSGVFAALGWLPLAGRGMQIGQRGRGGLAIALFAAAIAAATLGLLPLQIAFGLAAVGVVVANLITPREVYEAIDWPVIVLLGAMIPIGGALESTGAARLIAGGVVTLAGGVPPVVVLVVLLIVTMTLSDILNNAATVVVMAPIAATVARDLGVNADPFLMAVAIGGSCAFLTPIGHQNNTLVMGPGGYAFGDYWRMGLPLEALILLVATPMIVLVWPLH
jgi:di/tricarboxylate transporter